MEKRESFVFYRSFYECVKEMPPKSANALFIAICEYALNRKEPDLKGLESGIFAMIKPQIDANNKRYENGKKGGRPKGQNEEPKENQNKTTGFKNNGDSDNQSKTKEKPNVNDNVNDNGNVNVTPISPKKFEEFYSCCPRPDNRYETEKEYALASSIFSEDDLIISAKNYSEHCKILGTQEQFITMSHNWLKKADFEKYLPGKYKKPTAPAKKENAFNQFEQHDYDFAALEKELLKIR